MLISNVVKQLTRINISFFKERVWSEREEEIQKVYQFLDKQLNHTKYWLWSLSKPDAYLKGEGW